MANYLELKIPVRYKADWFSQLRQTAKAYGIPVRWQSAHFHVTAVFVNDDERVTDLCKVFNEHLNSRPALSLIIDRLDFFKTSNGGEYIIHLSSSHPSDEFTALISSLRSAAFALDVNIEAFILHITLGRVATDAVSMQRMHDMISAVTIPPFTISVKEAEYKYLRGNTIAVWSFNE